MAVSSVKDQQAISMGSAALASLFPFFMFFFGHYFSLSAVVTNYLDRKENVSRFPYTVVYGDSFSRVPVHKVADAFVAQVMAVVLFSYLLTCFSTVATVPISSGRHLSLPYGWFSRAGALWKEQSSPTARLYFFFMILGFHLSLIAVFVVTLVLAGDFLGQGTWRLLVSLLVLFTFLYLAILRSIGKGSFVHTAADEKGEIGDMAKVPWTTALALMEEKKLRGFFMFFFCLTTVYGLLFLGWEFWNSPRFEPLQPEEWGGGDVFYEKMMSLIRQTPPRGMVALAMNSVWTLGTCRLFKSLGALHQVW